MVLNDEQVIKHLFGEIREEYIFKETHKLPSLEIEHKTPKEMVEYLDRFVIGQEEAKKALAVAVSSHYRRIEAGVEDVKIPKSNVLIQGPTGSGKTYILKLLANLMDVPFCIVDASLITEAAYKGKDLESVITELYQSAGEDKEKAEKGIIYMDEFDKLSSRFGPENGERTVGAGVQRQMLKMIEGCTMEVPESGYKMQGSSITINTENILFICGGAFVGIEKVKDKKKYPIGFCTNFEETALEEENKEKLTAKDFVDYGLIPEVVGRLPIIVKLEELKEKELLDILTKSEDSLIKRYTELFKKTYNVELKFTDTAIEEIAHQAAIRKTGARGLNAMVEVLMQDLLFEVPSDPNIRGCYITKEVVQGIGKPRMIYEELER